MYSSNQNRYARQMRFAPIGESGQVKLGEARAAVVGMGALGCVIAQHLVRSGVGYVRVIDRDVVEWSNLQRQMLYTEQDASDLMPKAAAAAKRLSAMNSSVTISPVMADLTSSNAEELLEGVDLIIDGSDNFTVRYLINDYSVKHGIPWIYGGAVGASGMTMTIIPGLSPCYRCLFPSPPPPGTTDTCETAGVLSPIIDVIASVQSAEALKILAGIPESVHRTLFQVDLWNHSWFPMDLSEARRHDCPACGQNQFDYLDQVSSETLAVALCGRQSVHLTPGLSSTIDLDETADSLSRVGHVEKNTFLLKLQLHEDMTFVLFRDGRAIIQGTEDLTKARSIYAELLGI